MKYCNLSSCSFIVGFFTFWWFRFKQFFLNRNFKWSFFFKFSLRYFFNLVNFLALRWFRLDNNLVHLASAAQTGWWFKTKMLLDWKVQLHEFGNYKILKRLYFEPSSSEDILRLVETKLNETNLHQQEINFRPKLFHFHSMNQKGCTVVL